MKSIKQMDIDKRNYLFGILVAALITYVLTFIEIWQLIVIPGFIAGLMNYKKPRKGIYSGAIGVFISWGIYMSMAMLTRNAYMNFDLFAGLIFGGLGFGWVVLLLIILLGILFGALGGALGSGTMLFIQLRREGEGERDNGLLHYKCSFFILWSCS